MRIDATKAMCAKSAKEHIVTESLGFLLDVTITVGYFEKLGSHVTYENYETKQVAASSPHKINIKSGLGPTMAALVAAHEAYHLFKSIRHLITVDEETEAETFGELVSRIFSVTQAGGHTPE